MRPQILNSKHLKKIAFSLLFSILFITLSLAALPAQAYYSMPVSGTVTAFNLGQGVKVSVECTYRFSTELASGEAIIGQSYSRSLKLEDGTITIALYLPQPFDQWIRADAHLYAENVSLSEFNLPITGYESLGIGVTANIKAIPKAIMSVNGPATLNSDTVTFEQIGTKSFDIQVFSDAASGSSIEITEHFKVDISVGLTINAGPLSNTVPLTQISVLNLEPAMSTSDTVNIIPIVWLGRNSGLIIIVALVLLIAGFGTYTYFRVRPKLMAKQNSRIIQQEEPKPNKNPVSTASKDAEVYCMFCGNKLPSKAVFCRACGKKQE